MARSTFIILSIVFLFSMVTLEFFGTSRLDTQVEKCTFEAVSFQDIAQFLEVRFPDFARKCLLENDLSPGYLLCLNGETFIDPGKIHLKDGDSILLLSVDAGG